MPFGELYQTTIKGYGYEGVVEATSSIPPRNTTKQSIKDTTTLKLTGAKEMDVPTLEELGDRKFMNSQVLNIWSGFRVTKPKKTNIQATSSASPAQKVLAKQAAPRKNRQATGPKAHLR